MREEIRLLSSRLGHLSMESMNDAILDFRSTHQSKLDELSRQIERILEHQESRISWERAAPTEDVQAAAAHHRILESLRFPEANVRKESIAEAHSNTYEWIFQLGPATDGAHNFASWLMHINDDEASRIYWIRGKAGELLDSLIKRTWANYVSST